MAEQYGPNPTKAAADWPAVVVASAFRTGLLVARNLARRGVRVYLVDCDPNIEGFNSVYGTTFLCPDPDESAADWRAFMCDLAAQIGGTPVLMAASDQFVSAIGCQATELSSHYRLSPSAVLQSQLAVKEGQLRLATEHRLPMPQTCWVQNEAEVARFAEIAHFPVLIKPRQHRFWSKAGPTHPMHQVKALQADDRAALLAHYRTAARFSPDAVIQEIINGPETNKRVHVAVYRRDGERVAHCTLKELRGTRFGMPSVCEPIDDPEIASVCNRFFKSIGYRGTCEIELIWDERDRQPKMMDINPRFTGSGDAVNYAGIDQAWLCYLDMIGIDVEPVTASKRDFRHIMFLNDMAAIREYLQEGKLTWADLRRSYRRPLHYWDLDSRDWRLTLSTIWSSLRVTAGTFLWLCRAGRGKVASNAPRSGVRTDYADSRVKLDHGPKSLRGSPRADRGHVK